jgi:hypothetical protein
VRLLLQQARVAQDHRERVVDLVGHAGGEPPDAGQLLALHQPVLVLLDRRGHGVELPGQRPELVGRVHVDARVEPPCGETGGTRLETRDRAGDGAADVEAHRAGEERCAEQERHDPGEGPALHAFHLEAGRGDGCLGTGHLRLGEVLDACHQELRPGVLLLHEGPVSPDHRRDDAATEDVVELPAGPLDVVHRGTGLRRGAAGPQLAGELEDAALRLGIETQVALVADDDGVGLVGVLVANGAGELKRHAHALLRGLHAGDGVLGPAQSGERHPRRQAEDGDHGSEAEKEPARRA